MIKEMTPRVQALLAVSGSYHGSRLTRKLSEGQFDEVVAFIEDHEGLGHLEFEYAVNRWYLGAPTKPKNLFVMHELALAANTRAYGRSKEK